MLQTEFNFHSLIVQDNAGKYRPATGEEILDAAMREIDRRFSRGVVITSPADTQEYLRLKLAHLEHEVFALIWLVKYGPDIRTDTVPPRHWRI